jgi:dTDP-L-rhamnose 4-epimerase
MESELANYRVLNVGTGKPVTVMEVAELLMKNYGITVECQSTGQFRKGDIRHNYADVSLLQETLGFTPAITFDEGIRQFCQWVNVQEIQPDNYERSLEEMRQRGLMK